MFEKKYYEINEESARTAHELMSFREYVPGAKTKEYRSYVDAAYALAEEAAAARPDESDAIYALADKYSKRMADNMNNDSKIGCMCPSVMISGSGNFPTRKKERQVASWDRNIAEFNEIQKLLQKIRSIKNGTAIVKSGDANAIEKLQRKLDDAKALQEKMAAANKAVRLKDTAKGDERLAELGFSKDDIKALRTPDFAGRIGFPPFKLSNNSANIRRMEGRIKELQAAKSAGTTETTTEHFKIVENTELMRLQLIFDGKPDESVRKLLKSYSFKWAPSQKAWQRTLTRDAKWAAERIMTELDERSKESA